jgi:hypothetical protein
MLSYLLPQLKTLETEVISVNPTQTTLHLPDNRLMKNTKLPLFVAHGK